MVSTPAGGTATRYRRNNPDPDAGPDRFAALEIATGLVTDQCSTQHTNVGFLGLLRQVARAYPRVRLHVVCHNYATHKHADDKAWLNMVEFFFGIITRHAIRRGTFHHVKDVEDAIGVYVDGWNEHAHPFTWTKSADKISAHAKPSHQRTMSNTRH